MSVKGRGVRRRRFLGDLGFWVAAFVGAAAYFSPECGWVRPRRDARVPSIRVATQATRLRESETTTLRFALSAQKRVMGFRVQGSQPGVVLKDATDALGGRRHRGGDHRLFGALAR